MQKGELHKKNIKEISQICVKPNKTSQCQLKKSLGLGIFEDHFEHISGKIGSFLGALRE